MFSPNRLIATARALQTAAQRSSIPEKAIRTASASLRCRFNSAQQKRHQQTVAAADTHTDVAREPATSTPATQVKYTSESYPQIQRSSKYKQLTESDVQHFDDIVGGGSAIMYEPPSNNDDSLHKFNVDWMKKYRGQARLILKPETTQQVSEILKYCNEQKLAVCPQGGNTGLVGGSVPVFDEIVLELSRMNKVRSFDDVSGAFVADSGVILQVAEKYLRDHGHVFPLDLGAKGSCQIGGNFATNAGGLRLLRYGNLHGTVLGLEVVLPDGTIFDDLGVLRKNNTGYDLKQLFIGSEGTIGIITGISIMCPQRSNAVNVAYFGLKSYEHVMKTFKEAKKQLGEILSAFELMDHQSQILYNMATGASLPLADEHPFYCLIETSGSKHEHDSEKLNDFLEDVMTKELVADGVVAESETQAASLWACREGISEASQHFGGVYKYDFSIPLPKLYTLIEDVRKEFENNGLMGSTDDYPVLNVVGYGHMGDSNVHLNVAVRRYDKAVEKALEPWVYSLVSERNGSISAEHGLGLAKKQYIGYSKSEIAVGLMKQIKKLYDPNEIMNPYKYI